MEQHHGAEPTPLQNHNTSGSSANNAAVSIARSQFIILSQTVFFFFPPSLSSPPSDPQFCPTLVTTAAWQLNIQPLLVLCVCNSTSADQKPIRRRDVRFRSDGWSSTFATDALIFNTQILDIDMTALQQVDICQCRRPVSGCAVHQVLIMILILAPNDL